MLRFHLATIALGPLLIAQGIWTRARIPKLPEAAGAREGSIGDGPILRLLVAGDSAAAGVGVTHQDQALLGQVTARLAQRYRVEWTLAARTGATTASTLVSLDRLGERKFDVVVLSLGVNDVTSGIRISKWRKAQSELRAFLRSRFDAGLVIASGLPPVHRFPALPQPLRWYLGSRAKQFNHDLRSEVAAAQGCRFVDLRFPGDRSMMAADGFHPGAPVYSEWARRVADLVGEGANECG